MGLGGWKRLSLRGSAYRGPRSSFSVLSNQDAWSCSNRGPPLSCHVIVLLLPRGARGKSTLDVGNGPPHTKWQPSTHWQMGPTLSKKQRGLVELSALSECGSHVVSSFFSYPLLLPRSPLAGLRDTRDDGQRWRQQQQRVFKIRAAGPSIDPLIGRPPHTREIAIN